MVSLLLLSHLLSLPQIWILLSAELCLGSGTSFVFCHNCTIQAHIDAKKVSSVTVNPGIYVATCHAHTEVFSEPVGPLSLLTNHRDTIMDSKSLTLANWKGMFATSAASDATGVHEACSIFNTSGKVMIPKTPAPINFDNKFAASSYFGTTLFGEDIDKVLEEKLKPYKDLWKELAEQSDAVDLDPNYTVSGLLATNLDFKDKLKQALSDLGDSFDNLQDWVNDSMSRNALRLTAIEEMVGEAVGNFPSLWDGIETLDSSLKMLETTQDAVTRTATDLKSEFDTIFTSLSTWKGQVDSSVAMLTSQLGNSISNPTTQATTLAPLADLAGLYSELSTLKLERQADKRRIEALEAQLEMETIKVTLGPDSMRSAAELETYLRANGAQPTLNYAGFVDIFILLELIRLYKNPNLLGTSAENDPNKKRIDAEKLKLTVDETITNRTHGIAVPSIFGVHKSTLKSQLSLLPDYKSWRDRSHMTGLAYNITTGLYYVLREVQHIISLVYGQDPCLAHLMVCATAQTVKAQGFLTEFMKFIDKTYE